MAWRLGLGSVWVLLAVFLSGVLPGAALWEQDEAAYAGFALRMLRTGDWVVPDLTWAEIHRKPPLYFWLVATAYSLVRDLELAVRLPSALGVLGTCLLLYFQGRKVFGERRALLASWILSTGMLFPSLGKIGVTDGLLIFFETWAALCLSRVFIESSNEDRSNKAVLGFWIALGLGLLTKGPPIALMIGGMAGVLAAAHPERKRLLALRPWYGLPLALMPLVIWGYLAWQRTDGELIRWMLDWYGVRRLNQSMFNQAGPPGYHAMILCVAMLPWTGFLIAGMREWGSQLLRREPASMLLLAWMLSGWGLYEVFESKLPTYAMGALPALALIAAPAVDFSKSSSWRWTGVAPLVVLSCLIGAVLTGAAAALPSGATEQVGIVILVTLLASAAAMVLRDYPLLRMLGLGSMGLLISAVMWTSLLGGLEPLRSIARRVAVTASAWEAQAGIPITVVATRNFHLLGLPAYLEANGLKLRQVEEPGIQSVIAADRDEPVILLTDAQGCEILWQKPCVSQPVGMIELSGFSTDQFEVLRLWLIPNRALQERMRGPRQQLAGVAPSDG